MKLRPTILLLAASGALSAQEPPAAPAEPAPSPEPAPALEGELLFADQASLPGQPAGISPDGLVLWQSPLFATENHPFRTTSLDSIRYSGLPPLQEDLTVARITFQNHHDKIYDVLEAELLGFDADSVKLKTWYAGELTLKRAMLESIKVQNEAPAIVNGPGEIEDWNRIESEDAWLIQDRQFISQGKGSLARELPNLPDQVHIEFTFDFDYSPYLRLHFFADSGEDLMPRSGYSLSIMGGSMKFIKKIDLRTVPLQPIIFDRRHNFNTEEPTKVDIYLDRKEGIFTLYLDDRKICSTSDADPITDQHWFHLNTLRSSRQTISDFAIRTWDGTLPENENAVGFREEMMVEGELVELQNGDTIVGTPTAIEEGKLRIKTEYAPVAIPIERISSFQVTTEEEAQEPKMYSLDVRSYFHHGGHVTLRLSDITPTSITGYSQVFGEATFDLRAFSHIEFNPYEPEFRERRGQPLN